MKRCCNFYCDNAISDAILKKGQALKFVINKEGCSKVDQQIVFCDGTLNSSKECKSEFDKIKKQVTLENEGGPFGTPMRNLVEFLRRYQDSSVLYDLDKKKIKKLLNDFDQELNKVSAPI